MVITFVNAAADWGGGEGWTLRTAAGLAERGHSVDVVARANSPLARRAAEAPGIGSLPIPFSFDYHPRTITTLRAHLRQRGTEVVVVHHNKDVRTAGVAARLLGLPVVHRNGFPVVKNTLRHRLTMALVDRVLTNSTRIRDSYRRIGWLRGKPMDVVPNGIRLDIQPPAIDGLRASLNWPEDALVALFAGRLTGVKRVDLLLRAVAALPESSRWRLLIAGTGGQRDALERLAAELGLLGHSDPPPDDRRRPLPGHSDPPQGGKKVGLDPDHPAQRRDDPPALASKHGPGPSGRPGSRVIFLGHREDARALAASADLAVLPSLDEGMPNALMEAMAAGTAAAATPVGDVEFLLDHGRAGFILPMDGGPAPWTNMLTRLESSPDDLRRMGEAGHARIAERFTFEAMIDGVEASLRAAMG